MILRNEFAGSAMGVEGRFYNVVTWPAGDERWSGKIANQTFKASRPLLEDPNGTLTVEVRFDDNCKNGHETFAITADQKSRKFGYAFGCLHEAIAEVFPELAPLIPFHLCSTDGPMYYIANTVFHAGDRDCWGLRAGELQYDNELPAKSEEHRARLARTVLYGLDIPAQSDWQEKHRRPDIGREHDAAAPRRWLPVSMIDPKADVEKFEMKQMSPLHRIGEGKARDLDAARRRPPLRDLARGHRRRVVELAASLGSAARQPPARADGAVPETDSRLRVHLLGECIAMTAGRLYLAPDGQLVVLREARHIMTLDMRPPFEKRQGIHYHCIVVATGAEAIYNTLAEVEQRKYAI